MGAYTNGFGLTKVFKSTILERIADKCYRWFINVWFRHRLTIHRRRISEFDEIWNWCHDNIERSQWVFVWNGDDIHNMTFCFRQPKQLVYFALRWA